LFFDLLVPTYTGNTVTNSLLYTDSDSNVLVNKWIITQIKIKNEFIWDGRIQTGNQHAWTVIAIEESILLNSVAFKGCDLTLIFFKLCIFNVHNIHKGSSLYFYFELIYLYGMLICRPGVPSNIRHSLLQKLA